MKIRAFRTAQKGLNYFMIISIFFFLNKVSYAQDAEKIVIGHKTRMQSKILEKEIQLSVHVPANQDNPNERYPVLFTFQTHFESEFIDGDYAEMKKIGDSINTDGYWEEDPYIAPDESYILFCRRDDGFGSWDIFISFRKDDGTWTMAENMGNKINSSASEVYPFVAPDGKYLFFSSRRTIHKDYSEIPITYEEKIRILNSPGNGNADIYWVDATIIEELKPKESK